VEHVAHNRSVTSPLSSVPVARRRRAVWTLGAFALLLAAVGAVATTGRTSAATITFAVIGFGAAVLVGLIAWGIAHSITLDESDAMLEAVLTDAISTAGMTCSCGHEHDPDELHFVDGNGGVEGENAHAQHVTGRRAPACEHDGAGEACSHDCDTCVLASLRPSSS